jgi:predicted  nucleic acid-binding Zn-ribbon protein
LKDLKERHKAAASSARRSAGEVGDLQEKIEELQTDLDRVRAELETPEVDHAGGPEKARRLALENRCQELESSLKLSDDDLKHVSELRWLAISFTNCSSFLGRREAG